MNTINLAGRVAKDPETRGSVTTLIIATDRVKLNGLVTVLCRSPISLSHLGFEGERADAAQI